MSTGPEMRTMSLKLKEMKLLKTYNVFSNTAMEWQYFFGHFKILVVSYRLHCLMILFCFCFQFSSILFARTILLHLWTIHSIIHFHHSRLYKVDSVYTIFLKCLRLKAYRYWNQNFNINFDKCSKLQNCLPVCSTNVENLTLFFSPLTILRLL